MKEKWCWKKWLERLESAPVTDEVKATGRILAKVCKKGRPRWIMYAEVEWEGAGKDALRHLFRLKEANLAIYTVGHFSPALGPELPAAKSIVLRPDERALLSLMQDHGGGRDLYHINIHGYIDQKSERRRWKFSSHGGKSQFVPARIVQRLVRVGVLEKNGCGHGWPTQYTSEFRIAMHRLYAVKNLPRSLRCPEESKACPSTRPRLKSGRSSA